MRSNITDHIIDQDIRLVRINDRDTKYFESLWEIPEGVTYNSYILLTEEGAVLFDSAKHTYAEEYIDHLKKITDLRDIVYIVVHHMEPDHSGCIKKVAELSRATVIGHPLVEKMLKSFYGYAGGFQQVRDNQELKVGGITLRFIHTPWLHWPETIITYIPEKKTLISCDVFGSFGVFENTYYDELSSDARAQYRFFMKKYFADIIGSYREWVVKNLENVLSRVNGVDRILPAHGLCWRGDTVREAIDLYLNWGKGLFEKGKTTIVSFSMYGFVEKAVKELLEDLTGEGFKVAQHVFNDIDRSLTSNIVADAYDSESLVIALSTYDSDAFPLARHVSYILSKKIPRSKKIIVLSAHGWGARGGREIEAIFRQAGFANIDLFEFTAGQHSEAVSKALESLRKTRL